MAKPPPSDLVQFGPWPLGMNNVAREDSLGTNELRNALNVDIVKQGKIETRAGYTSFIEVANARSLWGDGDYAFYAVGANLYELQDEGSALRYTGLNPTQDVCYARTGPYTYFSDGSTLRIFDGTTLTVSAATPEAPGSAPVVTASATGGWNAGQYLVAATFVRASGEESVASEATSIDLTAGQGLTVSSIPQPVGADIIGVRIYVSDPNEPILYYRRAAAVGVTSLNVAKTAAGRALRGEFQSPMPAGHALLFFAGRLWTAVDNVLYYSEPFQYGVTDRLANTVTYPRKLALVAAVADGAPGAGLYIASGTRTYFISHSSPEQKAGRIVYPHGVVPGSLAMVPASSFDPRLDLGTDLAPVWLAKNGVICIGAADGRVVPMTEGRCVTDIYSRAAALYRQTAGANQYMVSAPPGATAVGRASDVMEVTVVRNGITDP